MSDFEDKLNHILSDPQELEKISRLAAQFMGGGASPGAGAPGAAAAESPPSGGLSDSLKALFGGGGGGGGNGGGDKSALLNALSPYLQQERKQKLLKALRLAQAARIAGVALENFGGDNGV